MLIPGQNSLGLPAGRRDGPLVSAVPGFKLHFQDRSYGEELEGSLFYSFYVLSKGHLCGTVEAAKS